MKNYLLIFALGLMVLTPKVFAQNASLSLSGESHDINLPVEITANSLSINQSSNSAIF
jgi:lipopolysaccharide export system protein LptA